MYWCLKNVKLVFDELLYVFILVYQGKFMISLINYKIEINYIYFDNKNIKLDYMILIIVQLFFNFFYKVYN